MYAGQDCSVRCDATPTSVPAAAAARTQLCSVPVAERIPYCASSVIGMCCALAVSVELSAPPPPTATVTTPPSKAKRARQREPARDVHSLTSATVSPCTVYSVSSDTRAFSPRCLPAAVGRSASPQPPPTPTSPPPPPFALRSLLPLVRPDPQPVLIRHAGATLEAHAGNTGPIAIILVFNGRGPGVGA